MPDNLSTRNPCSITWNLATVVNSHAEPEPPSLAGAGVLQSRVILPVAGLKVRLESEHSFFVKTLIKS